MPSYIVTLTPIADRRDVLFEILGSPDPEPDQVVVSIDRKATPVDEIADAAVKLLWGPDEKWDPTGPDTGVCFDREWRVEAVETVKAAGTTLPTITGRLWEAEKASGIRERCFADIAAIRAKTSLSAEADDLLDVAETIVKLHGEYTPQRFGASGLLLSYTSFLRDKTTASWWLKQGEWKLRRGEVLAIFAGCGFLFSPADMFGNR